MAKSATVTVKDNDDPTSKEISKRIEQYILVRNRIEEIKEKHTRELQPLLDIQNKISGVIEEALTALGPDVNSIKTKSGTAIRNTRYTASLGDAKAFMDFVTENKMFELIERKANVTAVREYVEKNRQLPPGVNLSAIRTIGVRVPGKNV